MGSTAPLERSGAAGGRVTPAAETNKTSSSGSTAPGPKMQRMKEVADWIEQRSSRRPETTLGARDSIEKTSGVREPARTEPIDRPDVVTPSEPKPEPKRRGLLGALKSFRGVMQGAATAIGGGAAAVGAASGLSLWMQTKLLNTLPMLGWAGLAAGGAIVAGLAGRALLKRARETVPTDGSDRTDGSKGTDGPSKGDPRNGDLPPQPPNDIPRDNDRRRGGRGLSNAGKVASAVAGAVALGALGFGVKAAFAGAGLALPPVAAGIGVAVGIGLIGMTVSRLFSGKKK